MCVASATMRHWQVKRAERWLANEIQGWVKINAGCRSVEDQFTEILSVFVLPFIHTFSVTLRNGSLLNCALLKCWFAVCIHATRYIVIRDCEMKNPPMFDFTIRSACQFFFLDLLSICAMQFFKFVYETHTPTNLFITA